MVSWLRDVSVAQARMVLRALVRRDRDRSRCDHLFAAWLSAKQAWIASGKGRDAPTESIE